MLRARAAALLDRALAFRAEGLSLAEAAPHAPAYLLKQALGRRRPEPGVAAQLSAWAPPAPPDAPVVARIGLLGDLMWLRGRALQPSPGLRRLFDQLDGLVANLETPLDPGQHQPRRRPDSRRYNTHPDAILGAFDRPGGGSRLLAVSLANNHALDAGPAGLAATRAALAARGIAALGLPGAPAHALRLGGALLAFAARGWGLNDPQPDPPIAAWPCLARSAPLPEADRAALAAAWPPGALRLLLLHWGHEFEAWPARGQLQIAAQLAADGVDAVIGSHPHVPQPGFALPRAGGGATWVWPSLGNAASVMPGRRARAAPMVELRVHAPGADGRPRLSAGPTHTLWSAPAGRRHVWALAAEVGRPALPPLLPVRPPVDTRAPSPWPPSDRSVVSA